MDFIGIQLVVTTWQPYAVASRIRVPKPLVYAAMMMSCANRQPALAIEVRLLNFCDSVLDQLDHALRAMLVKSSLAYALLCGADP